MTKFGLVKTQILQTLSESYVMGSMKEIKEVLTQIKENKDFKELYLFYEEVEAKYFEVKTDAQLYTESMEKLLREKSKLVENFTKKLGKKFAKVSVVESELYKNLDILSEEDSLNNIDKKIDARRKVVEFLITKKTIVESENVTFTNNENVLHSVLTSNFNAIFNHTMNEEEKKELKTILAITNEELEKNFMMLKEEIKSKLIDTLMFETDTEVKLKLEGAINETVSMGTTKYNYYKLQQLKKGL